MKLVFGFVLMLLTNTPGIEAACSVAYSCGVFCELEDDVTRGRGYCLADKAGVHCWCQNWSGVVVYEAESRCLTLNDFEPDWYADFCYPEIN